MFAKVRDALFVGSDIAFFPVLIYLIKLTSKQFPARAPRERLVPRERRDRVHECYIKTRVTHRLEERQEHAVLVVRRGNDEDRFPAPLSCECHRPLGLAACMRARFFKVEGRRGKPEPEHFVAYLPRRKAAVRTVVRAPDHGDRRRETFFEQSDCGGGAERTVPLQDKNDIALDHFLLFQEPHEFVSRGHAISFHRIGVPALRLLLSVFPTTASFFFLLIPGGGGPSVM